MTLYVAQSQVIKNGNSYRVSDQKAFMHMFILLALSAFFILLGQFIPSLLTIFTANLYIDRDLQRAGATPGTYDGSASITLNEDAVKTHAVGFSMSESIYTTDEGVACAVQFNHSQIPGGVAVFPMGWIAFSGPATNGAAKPAPLSVIPVDWDTKANTSFTINWSSLGGTQTGTIDATVSIYYSDGDVAQDVLNRFGVKTGLVPVRGGDLSRDDAVAVTAETAMPTFKIPDWATEIVGAWAVIILDTAVTASEEITGYIRVDLGLTKQKFNVPLSGGLPGLGTEVEGSDLMSSDMFWSPFYARKPAGAQKTCTPYANLASAITGGAQVILALVWR